MRVRVRGAGLRLGLLGLLVTSAVSIVALAVGLTHASASGGPGSSKHYVATEPIVVDKATGQLRKPTEQEISETIASLQSLTSDGAPVAAPTVGQNGVSSAPVGPDTTGVMLARPNADGTWETRCVFTMDEGLRFLGVVEQS